MREDAKLRTLPRALWLSGTLEPGAFSFREQIDIFRGASAVVAPHGAALTNILFAPNECRVLELFASRGGSNAYEVLATALRSGVTQPLRDSGSAPAFAGQHNNLLNYRRLRRCGKLAARYSLSELLNFFLKKKKKIYDVSALYFRVRLGLANLNMGRVDACGSLSSVRSVERRGVQWNVDGLASCRSMVLERMVR